MWTIDTWDFGELNFLIDLNLSIYLFETFRPVTQLKSSKYFVRDSTVDKIDARYEE